MYQYYFAILAPEEINEVVLKWKNFFKEKFECSIALRSPAHITLIPPFWMNHQLENELVSSLNEFCNAQQGFHIHLKGFSAFPPKVIFVEVLKNEKLEMLQKVFNDFIISNKKFHLKKKEAVFHPHITLASRDLYKKYFYEAWKIFSAKKYEATWLATGISLLRHNKKNWNVICTSQFPVNK
ncbi:MAG TPA: 2'-5' RNA ligase family protein [Chitinophagaceae bacterium]|nr:2'-5' RNA ligase family protein [Chitinophagaceae bacterium]